jgi:hypothetical protein
VRWLVRNQRAIWRSFIILSILGALLLQPIGFKSGALALALHHSGYFYEVISIGAALLAAGIGCGLLWLFIPDDEAELPDLND